MAFVQSKTNTADAAANIAATFTSNVTAGNLLVAVLNVDLGGAVSSISGGGTWTQAKTQIWNFDQSIDIWSCPNATGGATTVTATLTGSPNAALIIAEYSGVLTSSPLDKTASNTSGNGVNSSPADSGQTATTTQNYELLIGAAVAFQVATQSEANSFTLRDSVNQTTITIILSLQDMTVGTTGQYQVQVSLSPTTQWGAAIATFKLSPSTWPSLPLLGVQ